jgi:hypothetical protein
MAAAGWAGGAGLRGLLTGFKSKMADRHWDDVLTSNQKWPIGIGMMCWNQIKNGRQAFG